MPNYDVTSARPRHIALGTDDQSKKVIYPSIKEVPQHLPKFYTLAGKGNLEAELMTASEAMEKFGKEIFDYNSKFFTHQNIFMKTIMGAPNLAIVERVVPPVTITLDNQNPATTKEIDTPPAYLIPAIVAIEADVPNYLRNSDGSFVYENGSKKVDPNEQTISGYKLIFTTFAVPENQLPGMGYFIEENEIQAFENYNPSLVIGKDENNNDITGKYFPLGVFKTTAPGKAYNNLGFSFYPLTGDNADNEILKTGYFPYGIKHYDKSEGVKRLVKTMAGDENLKVVFGKNVLHPTYKTQLDIDYQINNSFSNTTDYTMPLKYNDFELIIVDKNSVNNLTKLLMEKEKDYIYTDDNPKTWEDGVTSGNVNWYDFKGEVIEDIEKEYQLLNFMTTESSSNIKYQSIHVFEDYIELTKSNINNITDTNYEFKRIIPSENTPIYFSGGTDGYYSITDGNPSITSISDYVEIYENAVLKKLSEYRNPNSKVQDLALNKEAVFYDSGFKANVKEEINAFISNRTDTIFGYSDYIWNEENKVSQLSESIALGGYLKSVYKLTPESFVFGTPVARAFGVLGSGFLIDDPYPYRVPQLLDVAYKLAKYMGAANGRWKAAERFDRVPGSYVNILKDLEPKYIPNTIKDKLWSIGYIYAQPFDEKRYHYPAMQTIYEDDTSVLNSVVTMMAICTLNKINDFIWRKYTGVTSMSESELKKAVEDEVNASVKDKFDNQFVIIPNCIITEKDKQRGYSWHLVVHIYANNMKSVMVSNIEAHRLSDLNG